MFAYEYYEGGYVRERERERIGERERKKINMRACMREREIKRDNFPFSSILTDQYIIYFLIRLFLLFL